MRSGEIPGSNSHAGGETEGKDEDPLSEEGKGQDPLSEEAALEATETGRKERGKENKQVHRGPQDQWTPGVRPIKTVCAKKFLKSKHLWLSSQHFFG